MKLRMLVHVAGAGFDLAPGDVTERFSGEEARRLIVSGAAVAEGIAEPVETAVRSAPARETRRKKVKA